MEYAPKKFVGKHAQQIISLVIHQNRTVKNNLVRVMENVKNEEHVTAISGDVPWGEYQEEITEAQLAEIAKKSTLKFSDKTVLPRKIMAMDKFLMDTLRNSRFAADMKAGAANITSNEFEQAVIAYLVPKLGKSFEKMFYLSITQDDKDLIAASATARAEFKAWAAAQTVGKVRGLVSQMIVDSINSPENSVIVVQAVAVTSANIAGEYKRIHAALPTEVAAKSTLFVPEGDFSLILQMNDDQQYRDKITVSGDDIETATVKYLGMKIEFVPINVRFAGIAGPDGDFALATDLLSDANEFKITEVNNIGDAKFGKAVAALDAAALLPQQKVLYI